MYAHVLIAYLLKCNILAIANYRHNEMYSLRNNKRDPTEYARPGEAFIVTNVSLQLVRNNVALEELSLVQACPYRL